MPVVLVLLKTMGTNRLPQEWVCKLISDTTADAQCKQALKGLCFAFNSEKVGANNQSKGVDSSSQVNLIDLSTLSVLSQINVFSTTNWTQ